MDEITIDMLLEFLYTKFAVTLIFCFIGSWIREVTRTFTKKESKFFNIKRTVTSTVFSTFLMCACLEYIDLQFEVYAAISVFCGMCGLSLINIIISDNFLIKFFTNLIKKISDPIVKSAIETASEVLDEQEKTKENNNE